MRTEALKRAQIKYRNKKPLAIKKAMAKFRKKQKEKKLNEMRKKLEWKNI